MLAGLHGRLTHASLTAPFAVFERHPELAETRVERAAQINFRRRVALTSAPGPSMGDGSRVPP